MTTSEGWLKNLLNNLVGRGGGLNSNGFRGTAVGTGANIFSRGLGGCVGMERPNGDVDENNIGIRRFT